MRSNGEGRATVFQACCVGSTRTWCAVPIYPQQSPVLVAWTWRTRTYPTRTRRRGRSGWCYRCRCRCCRRHLRDRRRVVDSRRCKRVARQTGYVTVVAVAIAIVVVVVDRGRGRGRGRDRGRDRGRGRSSGQSPVGKPSPKRARTPASLVASRESTALRVRGYRNEEPAGRWAS